MAYLRKGRYWYRSRREGGRVICEYIGYGDTGRLCAELDNQQVQERARVRSEWRAFVTQEHELDGQLDAVAAQLRGLVKRRSRSAAITSTVERGDGRGYVCRPRAYTG